MKGKTLGVKLRGRDYAMIAAVVAIFLSVAVMFGIAYRYIGRSEPGQDLARRLTSPMGGNLPSCTNDRLRPRRDASLAGPISHSPWRARTRRSCTTKMPSSASAKRSARRSKVRISGICGGRVKPPAAMRRPRAAQGPLSSGPAAEVRHEKCWARMRARSVALAAAFWGGQRRSVHKSQAAVAPIRTPVPAMINVCSLTPVMCGCSATDR